MVSNIIVIGCTILVVAAIAWAVIAEFSGSDEDEKNNNDKEDSKK